MAPAAPGMANDNQPFKAVLEHDMVALGAEGEKGLGEIMAATHAGMTTDAFAKTVSDWIVTARHPRFKRPYTELVYQPMLELLAYLRASGFKTFIVSGGGVEFMRPWTERVYGIPPEQVVGSSGETKFEMGPDGKPVLIKEAKVELVDDGPGKPAGINRFIGRRPIFAFGNSDGDQQMLEWTAAGDGARFIGIIHHTDAEREYAYDRQSPIGKLDQAWDEGVKRGWLIVDMRTDWKTVFPSQRLNAMASDAPSPVAATTTARDAVLELQRRINLSIIGQEAVVERLIIALLANGNVLIEGLPGLAKTRAIKALAFVLQSEFRRIQFTPDLLPSDITGGEIYRDGGRELGAFEFRKGPIFGNLILADEINRAPAKVQSALLEAMEERQVTVAGQRYKLPDLFMVLATQNPIEQEGTYPLPEAQMDRFLMHVTITYPSDADEERVLRLVRDEDGGGTAPDALERIPEQIVFDARGEISRITTADIVEKYIVALVSATRRPADYGDQLKKWIYIGASPRGSLALDRCSRARAWLKGRDFVTPEDVQAVAPDCLRHRIALSYEATAEGVRARSTSSPKSSLASRSPYERRRRPCLCRAERSNPASAPDPWLQLSAAPTGAQHPDRAARVEATRPWA